MTSKQVLLKLSVVKGYFFPNLLKTDSFIDFNINVTAMTNCYKSFQEIIMNVIFWEPSSKQSYVDNLQFVPIWAYGACPVLESWWGADQWFELRHSLSYSEKYICVITAMMAGNLSAGINWKSFPSTISAHSRHSWQGVRDQVSKWR